MALSVGEIEATLRLRDELSAKLAEVNKTIASTGTQFKATGVAGETSMTGMASTAMKMAGALGIGFSIASVVRFGKSVLDDADLLTKLSDKTGIAVEGLQRMRVAGDDASVSLDSMTMAVSMMQRRLAGDDASALKALDTLGIAFGDLRQLAPDQQFMAIADAIRGIKDPADQAKLAVDLFGRGGAEVLPVIKRGFDDVKDASVGMSTGAIAALDLLGDRLKAAGRSVAAYAGEWVGVMLQGGPLMAAAIAEARVMDEIRKAAELAAPKVKGIVPPGLPKDLDDIYLKLEQEQKALNEVAEAAARVAKELQQAQKIHEDYIASIGDRLFGADDIKRALDYAEAIGRVENISNMNAEAQAEVAEVMQKGVEAMVAAGIGADDLSSRFEALRLEATQTARDAADAMQYWAGTLDPGALVSIGKVDEGVRKLTGSVGVLSAEVLKGWPTLESLQQAAMVPGSFLGGSMGPALRSMGQVGFNWNTVGQSIPQFASGVDNFSGGPAIVGERGPELITLPRGASVTPGSTANSTVNIYVTQPLGTPDAIGKAIMANLRAQGVRLPSGA